MQHLDTIFWLPNKVVEKNNVDVFRKKIRETLLSIIALERKWISVKSVVWDIKWTLSRILSYQEDTIWDAEEKLILDFISYIENKFFTEQNLEIRSTFISETNAREKKKQLVQKIKNIQEKSKYIAQYPEVQSLSNLLNYIISSLEHSRIQDIHELEKEIYEIENYIDTKINTQKILELEKYFETLKHSCIDWIHWVYEFDSGKPGPNIWIWVCTHGNEPAGLAVFKYYFDNNLIPETGKITFVCNNLVATEQYFQEFWKKDTSHLRFKDTNMNRILLEDLNDEEKSYEVTRTKELSPIFKKFTHGVDIHSTLTKSTPMLLTIKWQCKNLIHWVPIETIIHNMTQVQTGVPISQFFWGLDSQIPVIGIECWQHEFGQGFETALECVLQFQKNIEKKNKDVNSNQEVKEFSVSHSVSFPLGFEVARDFGAFEKIHPWTVLWITKNGAKIKTKVWGTIMLWKKKWFTPKSPKEEVFFMMESI